MKILSWNVNGLRAVLKKDFLKVLDDLKPDVVGLQEIKISETAIEKEKIDIPGYRIIWNPAIRPGYSGTAVLIKDGGVSFNYFEPRMGNAKFDDEGRTQVVEFDNFYFINAYFPNANHELSRLDYKREYNREFLKLVKRLETEGILRANKIPPTPFLKGAENPPNPLSKGGGKPVIITGDLNVAHMEIDLARPKENIGNPGFTDEEREDMDKFIKSGLVDTFRHFYPKKIQYSWWSYRMRARENNIGWRIDYFLASKNFVPQISDSLILDKVTGSDHAPVMLILK